MIRNFLSRATLLGGALAMALLLSEVALRVIPIPGIQYNVSTYDPVTGFALYPGSTMIYRNERGDTANRRINSIGFLDLDHEKKKKNGVFRIGFFGDSYTEARQVPLDETFFRLIENRLGDSNVETLAFGVSGFSTLQSYLTYREWADYFDLDLVVYVFVDNDPGDNVPGLRANVSSPYPKIEQGELVIDNSFRAANSDKETLAFRAGDYLTSKSLLFSTLSDRISLLRQHGVMRTVTEEDRWMATRANDASAGNRAPTSDDFPSTWPKALRDQATAVTEAVTLHWLHDVEQDARDFVVFYVPRAREMSKASDQQDSWKPWLEAFCETHNITFLDPSPELLAAEHDGKEVFYDHFTKNGHDTFASAFLSWFNTAYP